MTTHDINMIRYLIKETLRSVATETVSDAILREASKHRELPADAEGARSFVENELHTATLDRLGHAVAEQVSEHLSSVLKNLVPPPEDQLQSFTEPMVDDPWSDLAHEMAAEPSAMELELDIEFAEEEAPENSSVLRTIPAGPPVAKLDMNQPTLAPPPAQLEASLSLAGEMTFEDSDIAVTVRPASHPVSHIQARLAETPVMGAPRSMIRARSSSPLVVVATTDPGALAELNLALSGAADVRMASDPLAVFDAIASTESPPALVVLDCTNPSVQPATLAALASSRPGTAPVLLWRSGTATDDLWSSIGMQDFNLLRRGTPIDKVAATCLELLAS